MSLQMKGQRGKPRRGRLPAQVKSVRLDPDAARALVKEFGSLGNACYYLFQGLEQVRENYKLPKHKTKQFEATKFLHLDDLLLISDALIAFIKNARDRRHSRPYRRILERLHDHIIKEDPKYFDLPEEVE